MAEKNTFIHYSNVTYDHTVEDEPDDFITLFYTVLMITVVAVTANSSDNSNHIHGHYIHDDNNLRNFCQYIVLLNYLYAEKSIICTILQD